MKCSAFREAMHAALEAEGDLAREMTEHMLVCEPCLDRCEQAVNEALEEME